MEKINLHAIAESFHENLKRESRQRAAEFVEKEVLPLLENAAKNGLYAVSVKITEKNVDWTDVQLEISEKVECSFFGGGNTFTVRW